MGLLALIKLQLKVNLGLSAMRWYYKNDLKKFLAMIGLAAVVIISLGSILLLYMVILQGIHMVTAELGQPEVVLAFGVMISSALVLFFGLTMVMSVFFLSRDLTMLVPLPLQPSAIVGSKLAVIICYEYLTVAPFFLPAIMVFGSGENVGVFYWVKALIVLLLIPILPLTIASLFVMLLMNLTNISRRGDILRMIGMAFFLLLVFALNYILTGVPAGEELVYIENLLGHSEGLLINMTRLYPPALFAVRTLAGSDLTALLNLGCFIAFNLVGLGLVALAGQKMFYRGLMGSTELSRGKELPGAVLAKKITTVSTPARAIAAREIKYLLRTPVYLFNSLAILIIVPVILLIPLISGGTIRSLISTISTEMPPLLQVTVLAGFIAAMALFAPAASSSFSREGKQFWISQVIPVSAREQIRGKVLYGFIVTSFSIPIALLVGQLFLSIGVWEYSLAVIIGLLISFPAITVNLLIDLIRPYLSWDNPQTAIKQNMNVLFGMLAGGMICTLIIIAGLASYALAGKEYPAYLTFIGGALLCGTFFYLLLQKIAPSRYRDIEI